MAVTKFRRIHTTDEEINLLQSNLADTMDSVTTNPILGGKLLSSVSLATGPNNLAHGLGRNYVSALLGVPSAVASVTVGPSVDRSKFVTLVSSAPVVLDVFIF